MIRSILIVFVVISISHFGFSQQKKFESFKEDLTTYKSQHSVLVYEDSILQKDDYDLKWVHIKGTYGGSPYWAKGKVTEVTPATDSLYKDKIKFEGVPPPFPGALRHKIELIGDQYMTEEFKYAESQPTSALHYVYVVKYYKRKQ